MGNKTPQNLNHVILSPLSAHTHRNSFNLQMLMLQN